MTRAFSGICSFQRPVGHAIVVADLPLLLNAQDLVEIDARNGREGRAFAGRIDGEAGVVGGQIDLADEGVGRLDGGDSGELQFLRQSVLKRLIHPIHEVAAPQRTRERIRFRLWQAKESGEGILCRFGREPQEHA